MKSHVRCLLTVALVTLFVPARAWPQPFGTAIETERIFDALGILDGQTVCEIGAGDGELSIAAARRVGPNGRVYTSELGEERVKTLRREVADSELTHITVVEGEAARTNFPDSSCDALFMRNVYHHFADPSRMNASIGAALKPGGKLAVVDFSPPNGNEADTPADRDTDGRHGVTSDTLRRELREAGFVEDAFEEGGSRWFMVVAAKRREPLRAGPPRRR
jgi:ubiquinone/menaquinone biosynthesis C-methylase UbiE